MKLMTSILLLSLLSCGVSSPETESETKIIGGTIAKPRSYFAEVTVQSRSGDSKYCD